MSENTGSIPPAVLLTRSAQDNRRLSLQFHQHGLESISLPMIEIRPVSPELSRLPSPQTKVTVLLTSRTATRAWLELREEYPRFREVEVANYLIVGRRSAAILLAEKPDASILALANSVEELLEDLTALNVQTGRLNSWLKPAPLLYPCSRVRRDEAVAGLSTLRYEVIELPIYEPYLPDRSLREFRTIIDALPPGAVITFFSPSAVTNFFVCLDHYNLTLDHLSNHRFAAIGSTTAESLYEKGIEEVMVPERPEMGLMVGVVVGCRV